MRQKDISNSAKLIHSSEKEKLLRCPQDILSCGQFDVFIEKMLVITICFNRPGAVLRRENHVYFALV